MDIQLKQSEIIEALKQYISNQGINTANKELSISFTAGRKEAGFTADISISEVINQSIYMPKPIECTAVDGQDKLLDTDDKEYIPSASSIFGN